MNFESTDTNPTRRRRAQALAEQEKRERIFQYVVNAYLELSESQALTSSNADPLGKRKKMAGSVLDFTIDVEQITRKALNDPKLFATWHQLLEDIENDTTMVPAPTRRHIVNVCTSAYCSAGLQPHVYFRPTRAGAA